MIEPPPGWVPPQRSTAASAQKERGNLTGSNIPASHSGSGGQPLVPVDPQLADTVDDSSMQLESSVKSAPSSDSPSGSDSPRLTRTKHSQDTTAEKEGAVEAAVARPASFESDQTRIMRRWLAIGLLATGGTLALIILAGLWLGRTRSEGDHRRSDVHADGQLSSRAVQSIADAGSAQQPAQSGDSLSPEGAPAATQSPTDPANPRAASTPTTSDPVPSDGGASAVASGGVSKQGDSSNPAASGHQESSSTTAHAAAANPMLPEAAPTAPPELGRRGVDAEAALRELEALTADTLIAPRALIGPSLYDLVPSPNRTFDSAAVLPNLPSRRAVNVQNQLSLKIPALDFRDIPLIDWCRFVQDFTTVPVTLDVDNLARVGLTARTPLSVQIRDEDLASALRKALEPLHLEWRTDGTQLFVTVAGIDSVETLRYEVFDLVQGSNPQQEQLVEWITNLIAPPAWQRHGGPGSISLDDGRLQVTTTRALQHEVRLFCDRLRVARRLRPQGVLPEYVRAGQPRIAAAIARLAQPVTIEEPVGVPLSKILDQIAAQSGLTVVVDWQGLLAEGWTPAALARLEVQEVSVSEALQQLLGPMRLSFRILDEQTLQVTTMERARNLEEIEFFSLEPLWGKDEGREVLRRIRAIFAEQTQMPASSGRIVLDSVSRTLIVAAPQYRIAQLAGLLERMAAPSDPADVPLPVLE